MPKILYNFACRFREEKMFAAINNIISLARHDDYVIHLTLDLDDSILTKQSVKEKIKSYGKKVKAHWGISGSKIAAINRDVDLVDGWDYLLNVSDDFIFIKEGFDLDILEAFNGFSGLLHFPDQKLGDLLITFAMLSKEYYDLDGFVYYPEYISVYADNDQMDVAKLRGKYKFVNKNIFEHRHSIWGYCERDELLEQTESPIIHAQDHTLYQERRKTNYGL